MTDIHFSNNIEKSDVFVVPVYKKENKGILLSEDILPNEIVGELKEVMENLKVSGSLDSVVRVPLSKNKHNINVVALVGLGHNPKPYLEDMRRAAGCASMKLLGFKKITFLFDDNSDIELLEAISTGALLGRYIYNEHKSKKINTKNADLTFITNINDTSVLKNKVKIIADSVTLARDLSNKPGIEIYPQTFVECIKENIKALRIKAKFWDFEQLKKDGFNVLATVGQGSKNKPMLAKLEYKPDGAKKHIAFVGKGITYDSGGLHIKALESMLTMQADMAGAASVFAAILAIAKLKLNVNVTAWIPLAENMPSGEAYRPSDIVKAKNGKTIEVLSTDAEGRLVLADAMSAAAMEKPDALVDIATLTGAATIALGYRIAGVLGANGDIKDKVIKSSKKIGEKIWELPLEWGYRHYIRSDVADIKNGSTFAKAGTIMGAIFLKEFVDDVNWAHIDIAATSFNVEVPYGYVPLGATGFGVRTLIQLADDLK